MKYRPNRNLVTRHLDGKVVNVARMRGSLFVCANACCCGREDLTNAPVPEAIYHKQWLERRLRNIVHLTVGGCLGPCALANVAMLLFDGRAMWFHSVNSEGTVVEVFDYIEAMLDADRVLPLPAALAPYAFTASTWEERPDGALVEDGRLWPGRVSRPDATPACDVPVAALQVGPDELGDAGVPLAPAITAMSGSISLPRANGEVVFEAPWQARAFGMAAGLNEADAYEWGEFRDQLVAAIARAEASDEPFDYYACWLEALEAVLATRGVVSEDELRERTAEFEFGERQEAF